nr:HAMP domain-containing sensor histidine kinase [Arthrobacter sp. zg-Y820]
MAEALALQRRFVADASHELRTPLTLLSTRTQLLRRRLAADPAGSAPAPEALQAADDVVADTKVLTGILEDLLMAADPRQSGPAEPVNLVALARSAVGSLEPEARRRNLTLEFDAPAPEVTVLGGQFALQRVFTALGANALDYGRSVVRFSVRSDSGEAVIRVSDDGPGFPPGFSRHAFERFASARSRDRQGAGDDSEGSKGGDGSSAQPRHYGLGLALVAEISARYGGSVRALPAGAGERAGNEADSGGVVEVRLPLDNSIRGRRTRWGRLRGLRERN